MKNGDQKYLLSGRLFDSPLPAWNLFTQENDSWAWSQPSPGQVSGKIRVLAESRNRSKLSLFRFHYSAWFFIFLWVFKHVHVACHPKASISFILHQRPLVFEHWLNIRLNNKTSCITHYLWHTLLFKCIFAGVYKRLSSLLTSRKLNVSKQLRIKSLN